MNILMKKKGKKTIFSNYICTITKMYTCYLKEVVLLLPTAGEMPRSLPCEVNIENLNKIITMG